MNQDIYEEDNAHLDADYRAVIKTRKLEYEISSLQDLQTEIDEMDGAPEAVGRTAAQTTGALPDQSSGHGVKQKIFEAAKADDVDTLRIYLADECRSLSEWSIRDPETGETVLHRALAHHSYRAVEFLLSTRRAADLVAASYDENVGGQVSRRTSLHQAVEAGRLDVVRSLLAALDQRQERKSLLSQGALHLSVGRRPRSVTCLHIAAMKVFDEIVEHLVSVCGVDVNEANECRDTALMWASLEGHRSTVALLIRLHADVNAANDQESTALHYAIRNKHSDVVRLLLEQGRANANARRNRGLERPLVLAAAMGSADIVRLLLKHGADVSARVHGSETALHYAASEGHLKVCQVLVNAGAELDATDSVGETALLEAARRGQVETVDYLLANQASLNKVTAHGCSAWTYAIEAADDRMLAILLKHASDFVNDYDDDGSNICKSRLSLRLSKRIKLPDGLLPLHAAARRGDIGKLHMLLSRNFSADDRDARGNTFVHAAAVANQWPLLEKYAVTRWASSINSEGRTPLHEACRLGHDKSVAVLSKITRLDIKSSYGSTVLHEAARACSSKDCSSAVHHIMKQIRLGRYWSLLDAQDDHGYTALHWAVKGGCKDVLQELRSLSLRVSDRDGNTPLHLAAASGDADVFVELLRLYSKDVHTAFQQANASGMTPLRLAILRGSQTIIEHAIRAGADVAAVEPDGKTVLHWIAEKITAEQSLTESFMQSVMTVSDMSVAWWATKKKQQMPDHQSPEYNQMKITALKTLFGVTGDREGFTVLQHAASIGCLPLTKHIVNLTDAFKFASKQDVCYDVTYFAPHTTMNESKNFCNRKVLPENNVSAVHEEIERNSPSDEGYASETASTSRQASSILELVVSNKNAMAAAAVLDISPFCDLAKPYWRWYQLMWVTGFVIHATTISLLTAYGVRNAHSFNQSDALEASSSSIDCSRLQMPWAADVIILLYVVCLLFILLTSLVNLFNDQRQQLLHCICGNSSTRNNSYRHENWHIDPIGEFIWKLCGLSFALTTFAGIMLNAFCIPFQDYLLSVAMLCGWIYLIYFLTRLRVLYQFSLMLRRILGDCLMFFMVFMFLLFAFSFAQHVAIQPFEKYSHQYLSETTFITFQWLIGMSNFWDIDVPSDDTNFKRYVFLALLYTAYIGMCTIVLMNLLIATMTDSFNGVRTNSAQLWRVDSLRQALKMQTSKLRFLYCLNSAARLRCLNSAAVGSYYCTQSRLHYNRRQKRWFLKILNAELQSFQGDVIDDDFTNSDVHML